MNAVTRDPLPGANVFLKGTALGDASDLKGYYEIFRIPPGAYTIRVSYVGYKTREETLQVTEGESKKLDLLLSPDMVQGGTLTITAQAEGQVAAINQQIRSNTITNVVSSERIQELPDANAAESVGRLPGVSIKRSGGEGNKIVIRGLAPTYNTITIGGEKIPATDLDDRSVDLNMISPEILSGIEVTKALTPDKDADAFGGIVDFKLADAPEGGARYNARLQEGYNSQRDELGQYKGNVTLSNRYWDQRFGLMITGNMERAQRGSDQFDAGYTVVREKRAGETNAPIAVESVSLDYADEIRRRLGFNVLMDYRLPRGKLMFSNFMSRLDREELVRTRRFSDDSNTQEKRLQDRLQQIDVLSNALSGEHQLFIGKLDWRFSRTASLTRHPSDSRFRFRERSALDQSKLPESYGPDQLIAAAYNDLTNTSSYEGHLYTEKAFERDYTSQLNLHMPFTLTQKLAGYIKLGGKYVNKTKERDRGHMVSRLDNKDAGYERHHSQFGTPGFQFQRLTTGWPSVYNYLDTDFQVSDFLDGAYEFGPSLDRNELKHLLRTYLQDSLYAVSSLYDLDDFEVTEKVAAGYIMSELNWGRIFMIMPGVRYENTRAHVTGRQGTAPDESYEPELDKPNISDTSAVASYGRWFPMVHARIRPTNWFDVRMAYTRTLSRPRLDWLLPKKKVYGAERTVEYGRPDLKPQISSNYDLFLSFYSNSIGLLTLGGFYKEIQDLIFLRQGHVIINAAAEGFPRELQSFILSRPENNPFLTTVKGWEAEWQTNLHWLPRPLDGLVVNVNYTHIRSETRFPRSLVLSQKIPTFPFVKTTVIDTFRVGSMPDQADAILNLSVGYDKGPFSARVSALYQGKTLHSVGERPELDGFTADLLRMDMSVKYKFSRKISVYFNWNNLTDEPDESYQQATNFPTNKEYYGWTTDVGIGYSF